MSPRRKTAGADITDGQLNLTIMGSLNGLNVTGIGLININEAGDYTIAGGGTPATSVFAGAIVRATVTEINGVTLPVPINLAPANASFGDSLPGNVIVGPWSLSTSVDVGAALAGLGFGPNQAATKVELAINNSLVATSEANNVAFIAKKEFRIVTGTDPGLVPEPSSVALLGMALCSLGFAGRKRS